MARASRVAAMVAACLSFAAPASAPPAPFSYLDLRLQAGAIDASLVIHVYDLAHDLKIDQADRLLDPAFAREQIKTIAALIGQRMVLVAGGPALSPGWGGRPGVGRRRAGGGDR